MKPPTLMFVLIGLTVGLESFHAEDAPDDAKAINGTWTVEKVVLKGADSTDAFKDVSLVIKDGKFTVDFAGMKDEGTIKIDSGKKPKEMEVESTEGINKGKKFLAIYELSGDRLKICYGLDEKTRPKALESKEDTETMFAIYKREKK